MAVVEAGFEESFCRALAKGSQYGKCFPTCTTERGDKEHCFFKERHFNYFADRLLIVSPLNALMRDQTVKLNDMQVRSLVVRNTESLSDVEINEIKQSKYRIIYNHPEVFLGKLCKLLDCEEVRCHMRAIVIDEAHLIVECQVFKSCLYFFPVTSV